LEHESLLRRYQEVLEERSALLDEQTRVQQLSLDHNSLKQSLHDSELAYTRLEASHTRLSSRVEREKANLAGLVEKASAACSKITTLRTRNRALQEENAQLREALAAAEAGTLDGKLQLALADMARELAVLRERNAALAGTVETMPYETAAGVRSELPGLIDRLDATVEELDRREDARARALEDEDVGTPGGSARKGRYQSPASGRSPRASGIRRSPR
jgi:DNA repair exonuclease SbcCD ATPase subunit